jgi:hypothetical protein
LIRFAFKQGPINHKFWSFYKNMILYSIKI